MCKEIIKANYISLKELLSPIEKSMEDLSKELGKKNPKLMLEGENILLSPHAAGLLSDGLTHVIRNSIDHGISKEQNSPEIHLKAYFDNEAHQVKFTYYDNGQGINIPKIRKKGLENGWINENTPEEKVAELIFRAGFSSREEVSKTSGRGVGMDSFLNGVRELHGDVYLNLAKSDENMMTRHFSLEFFIDGQYSCS